MVKICCFVYFVHGITIITVSLKFWCKAKPILCVVTFTAIPRSVIMRFSSDLDKTLDTKSELREKRPNCKRRKSSALTCDIL